VAISSPFDTPESLLKNADDALYASKRAGRNIVSCHREQPDPPDRTQSPRQSPHQSLDQSPDQDPRPALQPTRGY